jgi:hypothetical protein
MRLIRIVFHFIGTLRDYRFASRPPQKWNNSTFKPFKDEDLIETFSLSKNKSYILITEGDLQTAAEESVLVGRNSMGPLCIRRTDGSSDKSMYIVYRPIYPAVYIMGPHTSNGLGFSRWPISCAAKQC